MLKSIDEIQELTLNIKQERYPEAEVVFLAGSYLRGEATKFSDLDLVVVFSSLAQARRESFIYDAMPVEAFIHDPETLNYFFYEVDRPTGIPSLMNMVAEGVVTPKPTAFSESVKELAHSYLDLGPPPLTESEISTARYFLSDLMDDIRAPRNYDELVATGSVLYQKLADFYLRVQGAWSAKGKSIPRRLKAIDSDFYRQFSLAFEKLFRKGESGWVIGLAEQVLEAQGGQLFEGYQLTAPKDWRSSL
ncbi:MAG: nucleotidyltransferase domain-containing protein [Endozoicomonas sp.]|uniref:nucleotidyltransferase domain-containing protein n=1 Tax=Endozoicomonas sp. TaxID=1892382 RepID=UPI003D9BE651